MAKRAGTSVSARSDGDGASVAESDGSGRKAGEDSGRPLVKGGNVLFCHCERDI
ncbi:MAG: hypothetical protein J0M12_10365 [Deltaproteobacteria bacterium]|nr:hypothetical protein [Deltaproteobacteria bacterium]